MISRLQSIWIWSAAVVLILVWVPVLGLVRLVDRDPVHRRTARWFRRLGRAISRINPDWRLHFSGFSRPDPRQQYVIVSNHQSLADIPLITHLRLDMKWVAKAELFRLPVAGWLLRMSGDIPVDRSDRRKGAQALLQAARRLREGCSVIFFPEGTRSPDGAVLPFNDGPFHMAVKEGVPVLPLVVEGSGACLPKHGWMFKGVQDIYLTVLDPIATTGLQPGDVPSLRDRVRQSIIDTLELMRQTQPGCDRQGTDVPSRTAG